MLAAMKLPALIRTRGEKRVLSWPGLIITFLAYMVIFTISRYAVGLVFNALFNWKNALMEFGPLLLFGLWMSVVFLIWTAWRAWTHHGMEGPESPDRPSPSSPI
jgi:hypothetical protein